jgi:hypothetical protein
MRTFVMCLAVALAAAPGCKKEPRPADGTAAAGSAGAAAGSGSAQAVAPVPAPAGTVEIFVDDAPVAKVAKADIEKWPRLDALLSGDAQRLGTWMKVKLTGAKSEELQRPSQSHPDMIPALFPGEDGRPAFGMFDPVEHSKRGQPGLRADDIREIRIQLATEGRMGDHQGGAGEGADPMKLVVEIETPAGASKLTGEQILAQLLEAAGIKKFERLVLGDATGTSLILERKDLGAKKVPFVKLNKAGALRVRVLEQVGTGWKTAGELRSLSSIKVAK